MAVAAININLTEAIERLRTERDLLRRIIETTGATPELVGRRDQVEDQLIGALQERRRLRGIRYLQTVPGALPEGVRLVHNFHPGPPDDPGRHRNAGDNGFRFWITGEPGNDRRCYCGWLGGREHYGTGGGGRIVDSPRRMREEVTA